MNLSQTNELLLAINDATAIAESIANEIFDDQNRSLGQALTDARILQARLTTGRELAYEFGSARAIALVRSLTRTLGLIPHLTRDMRLVHNRACAESMTLVAARDSLRNRTIVADKTLARGLIDLLQQCRNLIIALPDELAEDLAFEERIAALAATRAVSHGVRKPPKISILAMQVTLLVVSLLPNANRSRYHEEFHAELTELGSRHRQLHYALRLLPRVVSLRKALQQAKTTQSNAG